MAANSNNCAVRAYVYDVLEGRDKGRRGAYLVNLFLIGLIGINVLAFVLHTVDYLAIHYGQWFDAILYVSLVLFSLEFLLRLWSCVCDDDGVYSHPLRGRLRFLLSPLALVDLAVLLPFFIAAAAGLDLRFLRLLRLLWILKITRYLPAMGILGRVLRRERRTLTAVISVMLIMVFIASSLIYLLEHETQPEAFASIPHALWWGVATLTTVGYGDVVPVSPLGKALGIVIMMLGIGTFALPAGVLASAFADESRRRDFMLTWNLVAQVPCFAHLTAHEIAGIASLLHPRDVMANEVLFHKGDEADGMYFIVSGELEAELQPQPARLRAGDFFGEVALLFHLPRTAAVIALTRGELLELDAKDLHRLLERRPTLKERILAEAQRRLERTREDEPGGDPLAALPPQQA
jgi:voltage-gated potassium channel